MSQTVALWLIPLAVIFYGVVCWAIGFQMGKEVDALLPDAVVNKDATPPNQFPSTSQWVEQNHIRRTVLR